MGVEGIPFPAALSHADFLEVSCHSFIKVLLSGLVSFLYQGTFVRSCILLMQLSYKLSKPLYECLNTKLLKYSTETVGKDYTNSNYTPSRDNANFIK